MGDDNGAGIIFGAILVIGIVAIFLGATIGGKNARDHIQAKCVVKYSDMPANKVDQFCKDLLEFN